MGLSYLCEILGVWPAPRSGIQLPLRGAVQGETFRELSGIQLPILPMCARERFVSCAVCCAFMLSGNGGGLRGGMAESCAFPRLFVLMFVLCLCFSCSCILDPPPL